MSSQQLRGVVGPAEPPGTGLLEGGRSGSRLVAAEWRAAATGCGEMETTRRLIEARQRPLRGDVIARAGAD